MLFNLSHARKVTLLSVQLLHCIDEFMWRKVFNILNMLKAFSIIIFMYFYLYFCVLLK